jgi:hypothetical protein
MNVYKQEILDGVGEAVKATASVAYCTQASVTTHEGTSAIIDKIVAANANPKQVDLYYIKSVLVSTGWNKNDDVFGPDITFAARNSPEDKQFNFMHDENDIIGHITGSYVVDQEGNKVDSDEAPPQFDIITEAVLYNSWTNPENRERMSNIIAEIEQGKWFVSMECLFAGFDYAVISPEGKHTTVARNEESAFLTKHLRAYGGTGEYEKYKVGRSLRDISFSGKGLVNKPANPRSYIIDSSDEQIRDDHNDHSLSYPKGDMKMSDELKEVAEELVVASEAVVAEETVAVQPDKPAPKPAPKKEKKPAPKPEVEEEVKDDSEATEEVAVEAPAEPEVTDEVVADEVAADCCESKDCTCDETKAEDETVVALEAKVAELTEALEAAKLTIAGYVEAAEAAEAAAKMEEKKAALAEAGVEGEEAEALLALSIEDEIFATILAAFAAKKVEVKEEETVEVKADESLVSESSDDTETEAVAADAEEVSEELFEEVSSTEATLIDASEDQSELENARAAVSDWLTNNVLSK